MVTKIISNDVIQIFQTVKNKKKQAVFIDRDGVLIKEVHLLHQINQVKLLPKSSSAIKLFNQAKIPVFVFTNQTVIARGLCQINDVIRINEEVVNRLRKKGCNINAIFFCPHSPKADIPSFKKNCLWRKPNPGMLLAAKKMFNIDLKKSFVIGDQARDILAGRKVEAISILVKTGYCGKDDLYQTQPDYFKNNLFEAAQFILSNLL